MTDVFCNSFMAGISQTVIGHPFDTVKTLKQMNNQIGSINIVKNLVKKNGVKYRKGSHDNGFWVCFPFWNSGWFCTECNYDRRPDHCQQVYPAYGNGN